MFDRERLDAMVTEGWLRSQRHPDADLWIYNYTERCQYEKHWTPETLACRGLILDGLGQVRARPFGKFFNYGDSLVGQIPNEPYVITEKVDGSLGILYWLNGEPHIASRGSFTSEQAIEGTKMLRERTIGVELRTTPLFEIVYPENRIVVDYGGRRELILLGCVDMASGRDFPLPDWDGPVVERHAPVDLGALVNDDRPNAEGYVVAFESGLRIKIKHAEYVRLHRIITGVNSRHIWAALAGDEPAVDGTEGLPDEIYGWIRNVEDQLFENYRKLEDLAAEVFAHRPASQDRKAHAAYFNSKPGIVTPICFRMLDGKDYADLIWKAIKPEPTTPDTVWNQEVAA